MNLDRERARRFLKTFLATLIVIVTFLASIAVIFPFIPWRFLTIIFGVSVFCVIFLLWMKTKPVHVIPEVLIESENSDGLVYLEVPMPNHMLLAANKHAMTIYGRHNALEFSIVDSWYKANQYVGAVLRSQNGEYLGYFDILPLKDVAATLLVSGQLCEKNILPEHILKPQEMKTAKTLYFAGFAVKDAGTEIGKCRASQLFLGVVEYMKYYYGDSPRQVLALAATPAGEKVLKGINAEIACTATARKNGCNLYEKMYTTEVLESFKRRAGQRGVLEKTKFSPIK